MQAAHINIASGGEGDRPRRRVCVTLELHVSNVHSAFTVLLPRVLENTSMGYVTHAVLLSLPHSPSVSLTGVFPRCPSSAPYEDAVTFCVTTVIKAFDLIADGIKSSGICALTAACHNRRRNCANGTSSTLTERHALDVWTAVLTFVL